YEDFLDRARMFGQEHMFLIGARILSGTVSAEQAGEAFARLADVLIRALHRAVEDAFAAVPGRVRAQERAGAARGNLRRRGAPPRGRAVPAGPSGGRRRLRRRSRPRA